MIMNKNRRDTSFAYALAHIFIIATVLIVGLAYFKFSVVSVFVIALFFIVLLARFNGFTLVEIQDYLIQGTKKSIFIILILMCGGMIIGTWVVSGIVPAIIYYGLHILSPTYFFITSSAPSLLIFPGVLMQRLERWELLL